MMRCLFNIFVSKTLVAELYLLLKCIWCCTPWANFSLGYIWDDLDVKTSMQYQTPHHVKISLSGKFYFPVSPVSLKVSKCLLWVRTSLSQGNTCSPCMRR